MPHSSTLLLLTRPRAQSARFAHAFAERFGTGFDVLTSPVMEIVLHDDPIPLEGVGGLIFTSENGVAGLAAVTEDRSLPAYCVGDRTAQAAHRAGLMARSAKGTAVELIEEIAADPPNGKLLHLRGEHARGDVCAGLRARGLDAEVRVVYDQRALTFDDSVRQAVKNAQLTLLPLFSPRSAQLVAAQLADIPCRLALVTMSQAVTDAWTGPTPVSLIQAERPDAAAMMDGLQKLIAAQAAP
ncbi:MAG: uroporphyrinogen-III synthase [Rhodobacteraceae bacterium]|nr:uroporphyrinogen-III synthase [Paracoccaceae bacterium]